MSTAGRRRMWPEALGARPPPGQLLARIVRYLSGARIFPCLHIVEYDFMINLHGAKNVRP
ncbi:hypothetical protein E0J21_03430 [Rhizobium laguerreae]|nr:hypothetical protein E0J21_03430 [Rhizobium laguerreae]